LVYDYFNVEIIDETDSGSYTDGNEATPIRSITWNHPLSEIMGALLKQGLHIQQFEEYDFSPYPCFPELREDQPGEFIFKQAGRKLPYAFALKATLPQ